MSPVVFHFSLLFPRYDSQMYRFYLLCRSIRPLHSLASQRTMPRCLYSLSKNNTTNSRITILNSERTSRGNFCEDVQRVYRICLQNNSAHSCKSFYPVKTELNYGMYTRYSSQTLRLHRGTEKKKQTLSTSYKFHSYTVRLRPSLFCKTFVTVIFERQKDRNVYWQIFNVKTKLLSRTSLDSIVSAIVYES